MSKIIHKPWGWEEIWAHTEKYVGKRLLIHENNKTAYESKEKNLTVIYGTLILEVYSNIKNGDSQFSLHYIDANSSFHLNAEIIKYRMTAGNNDVLLVEVSTPELDDIVRLEDDYGRK